MAIFSKITQEISAISAMVMLIVITSIILVKFKAVDGVTAGLNTTIDSAVTALSEPVNWVPIGIIALIGFTIIYLVTKNKKGSY